MCEWGTSVPVRVKVAAEQSHTGAAYWRDHHIDACIAPIVRALQDAGIDMLASCCGHETRPGRIDLADGRVLWVTDGKPGASQRAFKQEAMSVIEAQVGSGDRLTRVEERVWKDVKMEPFTKEDWRDLFLTLEQLKRRVIARHR